ncbi:hypothetical protein E2C01_027589 [Portunus trituberculatus]|uniref:Uncharacterized protein n=1 Tax=Portunus trituberculatus TaxID=210409 RepID=A0A5B7ELK0_PORTR|nr:hypothetical protein [Portunus trituberculatus]
MFGDVLTLERAKTDWITRLWTVARLLGSFVAMLFPRPHARASNYLSLLLTTSFDIERVKNR